MRKESTPQAAMRSLIAGYWVSRLIYVAARLGLADLLKDGPRTAEDLAAIARVRPAALYRVLRTLASYGLFAEISSGNNPEWGKLLDIQMMVLLSGKERTKEEFAALFKQAGLKMTRVISTSCPLSVVEGVRV